MSSCRFAHLDLEGRDERARGPAGDAAREAKLLQGRLQALGGALELGVGAGGARRVGVAVEQRHRRQGEVVGSIAGTRGACGGGGLGLARATDRTGLLAIGGSRSGNSGGRTRALAGGVAQEVWHSGVRGLLGLGLGRGGLGGLGVSRSRSFLGRALARPLGGGLGHLEGRLPQGGIIVGGIERCPGVEHGQLLGGLGVLDVELGVALAAQEARLGLLGGCVVDVKRAGAGLVVHARGLEATTQHTRAARTHEARLGLVEHSRLVLGGVHHRGLGGRVGALALL